MKYIIAIIGALFATALPVSLIESKSIGLLYLFIYLLYLSIQRIITVNQTNNTIVFYKFIQEAHPHIIEKDEVFSGQTFNQTMSIFKKNFSEYDALLHTKVVVTLVVVFFTMNM